MSIFKRSRSRDERPSLPQANTSTGPYVSNSPYGSFDDVIAADQAAYAATSVSEASLRGLPAANYAVNKIANAVASMSPLKAYDTDGVTQLTPTPLVVDRPLATMGTFAFWHQAVSSALTRGNFVGLLADFDDLGYARQVMPVHADLVNCYVDKAGFVVYDMLGHVWSTEQVVHVAGPHLLPGNPWAMSPVEVYRQALGMHVNEQTYGSNSFRTGGIPSAIIELDREQVPAAVAQQVQADWLSAHGSANRKPAVVPKTMRITPLSWSPHDSEFIESRRLSVAEAALMFDLSPGDLDASIAGTGAQLYANITDRQVARIVEVYTPWMRRFAEAWTDLLPGAQSARFEVESLLRLSPRELAEVQKIRIDSGVRTVDEERAAEGLTR